MKERGEKKNYINYKFCPLHLVMHVGKGGYWEGKADGKEGWFPRLAINELGDDEFHYTTSRVSVTKTITPAIPEETLGFPSTDLAKLPIGEIPESPTSTYTLDSISQDMAIRLVRFIL